MSAVQTSTGNKILDNAEETIGMSAAGPLLRSCTQSATRYALKGARTRTGVVYLESLRIGSRLFTSREACQRFILDMTAADGAKATPPPSTMERRQLSEDAVKELELAGC